MYKRQFEEYAKQTVLDYEDSRLEEKYPEFKALMREYRDGILLFELTDQKVWSMAVKDTAGLEAYYQEHKQDFMWPRRIEGTIYTCSNADVAKRTRKLVKKNTAISEILTEINVESQLDLKVESGKFGSVDKPILEKANWEVGISENIEENDQIVFVDIEQVLEPEPKQLDEAKGAITAAYQDQLEEDWIEELRSKYDYEVNREVLYTIQ